MLTLTPGALVVLEGLDATGKSTQSGALRLLLDPASTKHVHMPSGITPFTGKMYELLESRDHRPLNGLAKQLAHLACHAEMVPHLQHMLTTHAVVLDRWWWSTYAYGWSTGDLPEAGITEGAFRNFVDSIWAPVTASVVFLFDKPHRKDENNAKAVADGYHELAGGALDVVYVPQNDPDQVTRAIVEELRRRKLILQ